jgi:Carboxypeptidase regulatory-like domain
MADPAPQPENPPPTRQPRRRSSPGRRPLTQAQSRSLATWIFGGLFVAFLFAVFAFAPPALPVFKQRILAITSALLAGLFVYFLTGDLDVSIQGGKGKLGRLGVKSAGGAAAFVLVLAWWLSPWSLVESADVIRLRVLVLGPAESPVEDARVWTSLGGEPKQVAGGWEFDIPLSKVPADGKVTVHAAKESAFLSGSSEVRLGKDLATTATVRLAAPSNATVRGIVLDESGNAVEGVRVSVVGHEGETVTTGTGGQFVLPAHAANDQQVQLHAEKTGYRGITQNHPAGSFPATLTLERP